jgi:hypothetical protein
LSNIETGATEPIVSLVLDQLGQPLTGKTNIKARVWRVSDGKFLDWSDMTFKVAGSVSQLLQAMAEVSATAAPGEYRTALDTSLIANPIADDTYMVTVVQDGVNGAANMPQVGEARVGQWVDKIGNVYSVLCSFSFNPTADRLEGVVWVESGNFVLNSPALGACEVRWFNRDGSLLFSMTDAAPDTQGFYKVEKQGPGLAKNQLYYAVASVVITGVGTVTGGKGNFTF